MKRLLPIFFAASALFLAGCHTDDEGSLNDRGPSQPAGEIGTTETDVVSSEVPGGTPTAAVAGNAGGQTAAVFPLATPPSDRPSVTPRGYWEPRRVNTRPPLAEGTHGEGSHGEPTPGEPQGHENNANGEAPGH